MEVQTECPRAALTAGGVTQRSDPLSTPDCTPSTTFIYALLDSRTGHIRYVGKSDNPDQRLLRHTKERGSAHKNNWLRQLEREGLWPVLRVIEECSRDNWQERERYWIAFYREAGEPLTNILGGGQGMFEPTPEHRARIAAVQKEKWADPEYRERQSRVLAASHDEQWTAKRVATFKVTMADPERRAKKSAAQTEQWSDPEYRAKQAALQKAGWTDAARARRAEINKKQWADPEYRARQMAMRADPEYRARQGAGVKAKWDDHEWRVKHESAHREAMRSPEVREKLRAKWRDPEYRAKVLTARAEAAVVKAAEEAL